MDNQAIERALWSMYHHLGGEWVDSVPEEALAAYLAEQQPSAPKEAILDRIRCIRANRARLLELLTREHIPQRSPAWYELRRQRLTASDTAQALGKGKFGTREDLVARKRNERAGRPAPFNSNLPPLKWGTMFEPMATRCYAESRGGIMVHEFGLIPHPTLDCFGASPDGITELGTMVEIKCPFRRKINGVIPEQYWIQMQGQMAVCGITECDYIECDMEVFDSTETYYEKVAGSTEGHGVIAEYRRDGQDAFEYDYSDSGLAGIAAYRAMEQRASARMRAEKDLQLARLTLWRLRYMNILRVVYDHDKWIQIVPQIQSFWAEVLAVEVPEKEKEKEKGPRTLVLTDNPSPSSLGARGAGRGGRYQFLESDDEDD